MRDNVTIIRDRQCAIRRELDRRGVALKAISFDSCIGYETLLSYFPAPGGSREPAQIGGAAIFGLCNAVAAGSMPTDLLSLLLPEGFQIVRAPEGLDHDALCDLAQDYVDAKMKAHRTDSPAGVEIAACENDDLNKRFTCLAGGRKVA